MIRPGTNNKTQPLALSKIDVGSAFAGSLVGLWPFEEGVGATAGNLVSGGVPISLVGTSWTTGRDPKSYSILLDGVGGYAQFSSDTALNNSALTCLLWFNSTSTTLIQQLFCRDDGGSNRSLQFRIVSGTTIEFILFATGVADSQTALTLTDGNWHLIGFSYSFDSINTNYSVYLDGGKVATGSTAGQVRIVSAPMTIGTMGGNQFLTGKIDSPMVLTRALTDAEHTSLYNNYWQSVLYQYRMSWPLNSPRS